MGNGSNKANAEGNSQNADRDGTGEKVSYYKQAKQGYNQLVNAIIRPPRAEYTDDMLGAKYFTMGGRRFERKDLTIRNFRGKYLQCSHWLPIENEVPPPCVIYLHGNSSCRLEAMECLNVLLSQGISLFTFDFSGSGRSDGDYISLGWFERDDVSAVVEHLRASKSVSTIGLWGRSMGAATALMFARRDPSIACLVLDSPFASLPQLARELVESSQVQVPKFAVSLALKFIRNSVKSRAKFDINKLEPIKYCGESFIPALFGAAEEDSFIQPHHARQLHDAYSGDKNIVLFSGNHNTRREKFFFASVSIFLHETLVKPAYGGKIPEFDQEPDESLDMFGPHIFDMPLPMERMNRAATGKQMDLCQTKRDIVDEEEEMIQRAMELSLQEFQESQKNTNQ